MRILTHNMLCCLKCDHFPLKINATTKEEQAQDFNEKFIIRMLPKIDYSALLSAANDLAIQGLPESLPENVEQNQTALQAMHKLLQEVVVKEGELVCTNCGRSYHISQGIPHMILREDEVMEKKKKIGSTPHSTTTTTTTTNASQDDVDMDKDA